MNDPRSLLAADVRQVLDRMARVSRAPLYELTAQQARAAYAAAANVLEPAVQPVASVQDISLPMRDGQHIAARVYANAEGRLPVMVFFHGGGFVVGGLDTHDGLCRRLCALSGCAVVSVDYRLAPEHRFPVAFEDAWDSLSYIAQHGAQWGLDGLRIAVGGDSAGGTLAAACAIEARDKGLDLRLQFLLYPGLMGHQDSPSHQTFAQGFLLDRRLVDYFFGLYIRQPADRDDWRFAPLDGCDAQGYERDLHGVAPAWLCLPECDPLIDEGIAYADRLRMAGVPVDLEIYRGMVHEFMKMGRAIKASQRAHEDAALALRQALA